MNDTMKDSNQGKFRSSANKTKNRIGGSGKKFDLKAFFSHKRFRYGGYATLATIILILLVIGLNLALSAFDASYNLKLDLTQSNMYEISDDSYKLLGYLKEDVVIYTTNQIGAEDTYDDMVNLVIDKYKVASDKITVKNVDPVTNPLFVEKYATTSNSTIPRGSVVVATADDRKWRVLTKTDLFDYEIDTSNYSYNITGLRAEQAITSALLYIIEDDTPRVFFLQGHGEYTYADIKKFYDIVEDMNYECNMLDLQVDGNILQPGDTLVVVGPDTDLSVDEREIIKEFLSNGGKAMFMLDYAGTKGDALTLFESLISYYGVTVNKDYVIEQSSSNYRDFKTLLVPNITSDEITLNLIKSNTKVLLYNCRSISLPELEDEYVSIVPLLTTSSSAFSRSNFDPENTDLLTITQEPDDAVGPFNVAVKITKKYTDGRDSTKMVVIGTSSQLGTEQFSAIGGNFEFLCNCISWMSPEKAGVAIDAKSFMVDYLQINTDAEMTVLFVIVAGVIPLTVFIAGFAVWLRRRHL